MNNNAGRNKQKATGNAARQFNRSFVLAVLLLQYITIIVVITTWVVTDRADDEIITILEWQFFHAFTLFAFFALLALYVMVNRSMIPNNPDPPNNLLYANIALQIAALIAAVVLIAGAFTFYKPENPNDNDILKNVSGFYIFINILAALVAIFALIVLPLLRWVHILAYEKTRAPPSNANAATKAHIQHFH